jgi:lipopolysaccharide biosynthesis glycosyltransferase
MTDTGYTLFIGYDPREDEAYRVCVHSIQRHAKQPVEIVPLILPDLRARGLYTRPIEKRGAQMWDTISDAPMSTEFAISRFLLPHLTQKPWAIFCDCDFLWRADPAELFALRDDSKALQCVQHDHRPPETVKMDDCAQVQYSRKNWSSLMMWNLRHPAHKALTVEAINTVPGRDLHRFYWLKDAEIGNLDVTWNWLEGTYPTSLNPKVIHYTRGGAWFDHWKHVDFAQEWLDERDMMEAK